MTFGLSGPPLAAFDTQPLFQDTGITLALMGLLVVFAALVLVGLFIALLPRMMGLLEQFVPEKSAAPAAKPQAEAPKDDSPPDEVVAVIAAVVAHIVRKPHRIVRTVDLTPDDKTWSMEGRRQHHVSHRIQTRGKGPS